MLKQKKNLIQYRGRDDDVWVNPLASSSFLPADASTVRTIDLTE